MDKLIVAASAILLIGLIVWWFFGKRNDNEVAATIQNNQQAVEVIVDGGYIPHTVILKKDIPAKIVFTRKDPSSCLEEVVFPDFGIKEMLPMSKSHEISIDTKKTGEYKYACGMNMFFGKVVIK